jgi:DNA-binding protein YbaB
VLNSADFDLEKLLRDAQQRAAKMMAIRERTSRLTGQAESSSGHVRVTSSADDPVAELHIDPRAMRMPAEDLSAAIRATIAEARRDLDRQIEELTAFEYGESMNPLEAMKNKESMKRTLGEVQGMFEKTGRETRSMIDQLKRDFGLTDLGPKY